MGECDEAGEHKEGEGGMNGKKIRAPRYSKKKGIADFLEREILYLDSKSLEDTDAKNFMMYETARQEAIWIYQRVTGDVKREW